MFGSFDYNFSKIQPAHQVYREIWKTVCTGGIFEEVQMKVYKQ